MEKEEDRQVDISNYFIFLVLPFQTPGLILPILKSTRKKNMYIQIEINQNQSGLINRDCVRIPIYTYIYHRSSVLLIVNNTKINTQ
jgi:hypothetical protein